MSYHQLLIQEVDYELAVTRKMLARVPADNWDYCPHDKSMKLGQLASHLVDILEWGVKTLERDVCDLPADHQAFVAYSPEALLKKFDESAENLKRLVADLEESRINDPWTLKYEGNDMFTMPRLQVLRQWTLNHMVHHRAQLGIYLRLRDVPLPSTYGPSADEAVSLL